MLRRTIVLIAVTGCSCSTMTLLAQTAVPTAVVCVKDAPATDRLAAQEVRRYLYLRTATLLPIVNQLAAAPKGAVIVVGRAAVQSLGSDPLVSQFQGLQPDEYRLTTMQLDDRPVLAIAGGGECGTLYGAYRLAEHLGVRFYLHGDVIPDRQIALELPALDETRRPLFQHRGIQPFHDFPEGPDWWSRDGYKAVLGQLPKMGLNFIGLHTYPEGGVGPEPLVWIGTADGLAADGKVKASYPARHFTTDSHPPAWGFVPGKTSDFVCGAAELFDRDDYGADYMRDTYPWHSMSPEQCNALFDRVGEFFSDVFAYAHRLGIKTCLGTETPLTVPAAVKQRLQAMGKDPNDPAVMQELYEGMLQRITRIHPLDYYWLWTPEGWTWEAVKPQQIDATMTDLRAFLAAAKKLNVPFTPATCGWVLGPPQNPALFDDFLPKEVPMSCINRTVGNTPVEPGFARITGRPKWAIPWLEDDPGMTIPQLWVGRMRKDAADSLTYGCTGLLGIHWRTRILAPNAAALAQAAWDQTGWNGEPKPEDSDSDAKKPEGADGGHVAPFPANAIAETQDAPVYQTVRYDVNADNPSRFLPVADFYADWAHAEFGPEASAAIAAIFSRLDGRLPRPADWVTGPGSVRPDGRPWQQVQHDYVFVDELAALRPQIVGPGNVERFDYWLNNFRYLRSIAQMNCTWARMNEALATAAAEIDSQQQQQLAREIALPRRKELVAAFADMQRHLLATVSNAGEMGNVSNWQQQTLPVMLTAPGHELARLLGQPLPADAVPTKEYTGEPRLFVTEVRTAVVAGEALNLKVVMLGIKPQIAQLHWRPLGAEPFQTLPLTHVARGVYSVSLPAEAVAADFEYYVQATASDRSLVFPATAPAINQTVVVCD